MRNYQARAYCTCCKERIYRDQVDDETLRSLECDCNFVNLQIESYAKCLICIDCSTICVPGQLPIIIYYIPNANQVLMLFEPYENVCISYIIESNVDLRFPEHTELF